jgi:Flp pilus assembly protein TadD
MRVLILTLMLASPAHAQDACPPLPDRSAETFAILGQLARSASEAQAQELSGALWAIWLAAPDTRAQQLLDQGMLMRSRGDFATSLRMLGDLIAYCPAYAEAWNQRAFTSFLAGDFAAALLDIDEALLREPHHLGALTGKALTLIGLGRDDEAQEVLRDALAINPWLAERALLTEPMGTPL